MANSVASMLSLNDDCLCMIVSCIDDARSFYSVAITCKRLLQVTKSRRKILHPNLLPTKAEYYLKHHFLDLAHCTPGQTGRKTLQKRLSAYEGFRKLRDVLHGAVRFTEAKKLLTYPRIVDVWQKNGPVVAKLLTWVRDQDAEVKNGVHQRISATEHTCVTLNLPHCEKDMVISASFYFDHSRWFDSKLKIDVTCGDLNVSSECVTHKPIKDHLKWEQDEVRRAVGPMRPAKALLQKELGDTIPPITDQFFIWLCYFFPDKGNLPEEHKLRFRDTDKNMKPTPITEQSAVHVDLFQQNLQAETKFQNLLLEWKNSQGQESPYSTMIVETIDLLAWRTQTVLLKSIESNADTFFHLAFIMAPSPKQLLLDVLLRTSLEGSTCTPGSIARKCVESTVFFRCPGFSNVMKVHGCLHGDGLWCRSWHKLELDFTLPNGEVLKLDTGFVPLVDRTTKRTLAIEHLSPATQLIQQGIDQTMHGEKRIPRIRNIFTAVYFMHALEFSNALTTFLGSYSIDDFS